MSVNEKIIGLNSMLNDLAYQLKISQKTDDIMGDSYEIDTDALLSNKKFESIFTVSDNVNMKDITQSIKDIVGKKITKRELNLILVVMDADLQNVTSEDGVQKEKFIFDSNLEVADTNGLFQMTKDEIFKLKSRSHYFRESRLPTCRKTDDGRRIVEYEDGAVLWEFDDNTTIKSVDIKLFLSRLFRGKNKTQPEFKDSN